MSFRVGPETLRRREKSICPAGNRAHSLSLSRLVCPGSLFRYSSANLSVFPFPGLYSYARSSFSLCLFPQFLIYSFSVGLTKTVIMNSESENMIR